MASPTPAATYEDLAALELSFEAIDTAVSACQALLSSSLYTQRAAVAARIPHFWPLVLEQAPPEIDQFIQPSDSALFAKCLTSISVERFEIPAAADVSDLRAATKGRTKSVGEAFGEPRSFSIRFAFEENEWFEDRVLEKRFWFRRARDGYTARVSEPVRIRWRKGKDLTDGLTDAAVALWEAQRKAGYTGSGAVGPKGVDDKVKELPEYKALEKKIDASTEGSQSFFTFFGYRGRWISAEENEAAVAEEAEKRAKVAAGEKMEPEKEQDEDEDVEDFESSELDTDIFPAGEDLAVAIAEDVWPNAIKYFTEAQEDHEIGSVDFDDSDDDEDDNMEEVSMEEIKNLVNKPSKNKSEGSAETATPAKKRKT